MIKRLIILLILLPACLSNPTPTPTPEPVVEEVVFDQVVDDGKLYTSKDFFDAGFKEYKEYNVSKLTGATEAWYGYWGPDEDSDVYYELRFYPDHSTAVSDGTLFAEDATGEDAKLDRKETMWRVGLPDRKINASCEYSHGNRQSTGGSGKCGKRFYKYGSYLIYSNIVLLCEGDVEESLKSCREIVGLISPSN